MQHELRDNQTIDKLINIISIIPSLRETKTDYDNWLSQLYLPLKEVLREITLKHEDPNVFEIIHIISLLEFTHNTYKNDLKHYINVLNTIRDQLSDLEQ